MGLTVIIADAQNEYMQRLKQYMDKFYEGKIDIACCLGKEDLREAIHATPDPLVLIGEELVMPSQKLLCDVPAVVMTEERSSCSIPNAYSIWKYQRIDVLYDEITAAYGKRGSLVLFHKPKPWELLLFQGTSGGTGTSTMAAVCARNLAQMGRKVLYLNLETLGTADFYFQSSQGMDLGTFLHEMENGANAEDLIEKSVKKDS
ncbi:MAG: hypothetical protein LIO37_03575 [Clostridiales bacterium]|nr:hypothetical protein [Clostridiales bacterium]